MKKNYSFDTTLGIIKGECASVRSSDLTEHEKMQEMDLPNGVPSLVFEPAKTIIDISQNPLIQITENELSIFQEDNIVKLTELTFFDNSVVRMLIPFEEFEKFFIEYKRAILK